MSSRLLTPALLLLLFFAAAAHADPLVITSGSFTATGAIAGEKAIVISGPNFQFSASSSLPALVPNLIPGGGARTLGVIGNFDGGTFVFNTGLVDFPNLGDIGPTTFTFTVPFTMTGQFFGQVVGNPTPTTLFVVGRGDATFTYLAILGTDGQTRYEFRSLQATFADATPEPATLLLLTTGLAGFAAARRRRRR